MALTALSIQFPPILCLITNSGPQFEHKLAESEYLKKPEKISAETDDIRKSYNPSRTTERSLGTAPARSTQGDFFKPLKVDMSNENVSTRQFTGEGEKEGLRLSNVSSPIIQTIQADISKAELVEIIAQLRRVNEVCFLLFLLFTQKNKDFFNYSIETIKSY